MVWVSLTYTDAQTGGSGHGGLSEYPQHMEILRLGAGAWWTSLAYMDVLTGSLGHGGHPWHTWMFRRGVYILGIHGCSDREFGAWWTSLVYMDVQTGSLHPWHTWMFRQGVWGMVDILGIHGCSDREFGAWWTSLAYMDVQTGSLGHGGHPRIVYIAAAC